MLYAVLAFLVFDFSLLYSAAYKAKHDAVQWETYHAQLRNILLGQGSDSIFKGMELSGSDNYLEILVPPCILTWRCTIVILIVS